MNYETFELNKETVEKSIREWIKGKDKTSSVLQNNVSVVQAVSQKKKDHSIAGAGGGLSQVNATSKSNAASQKIVVFHPSQSNRNDSQ